MSIVISDFSDELLQITLDPALWAGGIVPELSEQPLVITVSGTGFDVIEGVPVAGTFEEAVYEILMDVDGVETLVTLFDGAIGTPELNSVEDFLALFLGVLTPTQWIVSTVYGALNAGLEGAVTGSPGEGLVAVGEGADKVVAGAGNDAFLAMGGIEISGGAGNDTIYVYGDAGQLKGGTGDDTLYGGIGDDKLSGNRGADELSGRAGDDLLKGGGDRDTLNGDAGDDWLAGGRGDDSLYGGEGNDHLRGGVGDDVMFGGEGDDKMVGQRGNDVMFGGLGANVLKGGGGNDVLISDGGIDTLKGGADADKFVFNITADPAFSNHHDMTNTATVLDFTIGEDVLQFGPHNNGAYTAEVAMELFLANAAQVGDDVVFDDGVATITLVDVALDALSLSDFSGAPDSGFYDWG